MTVSLKESIFSTGADNKLATVDVYNLTDKTKLNTLTNLEVKVADTAIASIFSATGIKSKALLKQVNSLAKKTITSQNALNKIAAVNPNSTSTLNGLTSSQKSLINSGINTSALDNLIKVNVGGVKSLVKYTDAGTLSTITTVLSKLTNSAVGVVASEVKSSVAVLASTVKSALKIGVDGTLGPVLNTISDQKTKDTLILSTMDDVVNNGAVNDLNSASTHASKGLILQDRPTICNDVVSNFKSYSNHSDDEVDKDMGTFFSSMKNIYGKDDWYVQKRNDTDSSVNLTGLISTNDNFKVAVGRIKPNLGDYNISDATSANITKDKMLCLSKNIDQFEPTSVKESINTLHPYSYVADNPQINSDLTLENV